MSLVTKNVAAVVVGLGLVFAFAFATPAKAQTIAELQTMIQTLLAQIAALQAQAGGSTGGSGAACFTFTRNHQLGDTGGEVMQIQKFLNTHGAQVSASGAGSPGNETSYFGSLSKAAVAKFQAANGISPAAGYWGPITRAKANSMCTTSGGTTGGGTVVTGNGLKVMLGASPMYGTLVQGQAIGELAKFTFSNPTGVPVTVTSVSFNRIGVSSDSTLSNVYLFQGATRLTDSAGISTGAFTFNDPTGLFVVPAGSMVEVSVRADIASNSYGQQIGVQLTNVTATGALDSSVVLPISGSTLTISSASMGTIAFTYTGPSNAAESPANDVRVFEASTVVSTHKARLESITFENRGTTDDEDFQNLRLFIDGVQVGSAVARPVNDKVVFDLSGNPVTLDTGTRIIKVLADVVGGSSYTFDFQIRRAADVRAIDAELNQPILATDSNGFPVSAASSNSVSAATLSVVRAASSPSTNIPVGATNILLAKYEVRAAGENVKIEAAKVWIDQTSAAAAGMDNVKVFLNGAQVGSTKDVITDNNPDNDGTEFTFGSSFIARQGQVEIVEIYGDAKTSSGTNYASGVTLDAGFSIATADTQGMDSGNTVSAIAEVEGFSRSVTSSTLTMSQNTGYGAQSIISGTNNAKVGSFTLAAGSTENVNINTITITLSSDEAASITDLRLVDNATGVQIGTAKAAPGTSNSFSVNFQVPASGTKVVDILANVKSGANAGPWIAAVDGSGTGATTAQNVTFGNSSTGTLQTITIAGSGTLTTAVGVSPDDANVIAGSSMVKVGSFNFTATNSFQTVQEIKVKVPSGAATSVSLVTLKYKNEAGTEVSSSAALVNPSTTESHATATFTGLTFYVPMNTTRTLDVYVNVPTVTSGATSGTGITVVLDGNEGFKSVDAAGNSTTALTSSADLSSAGTSGKGTMYVRKSIPTISSVALDSNTLTAGSNKALARVKVSADAAGDVDWGQIAFTINKSAGVTFGATSTVKLYEGSNVVAGSFATTTGSLLGGLDSFGALTSGILSFRPDSARTIAAGGSATYELRGTVGSLASGYNFLSVSVANPSSSVSTNNFTTIADTLGAGTPSFVWSDWSDVADHASSATGGSTTDWTNDYLVKTLPLTLSTSENSI